MPPSHHSSSSHSSHSHSSHSSHSSSRSSSRSYSSSRSSSSRGPSSHSSSSHSSSSSRSSSGSTYHAPRPRRNQPSGYSRNDHRQFQCRTHDYVYYPIPWTVGTTTYQAGYYDEDGNHYDSVAIKNEETICKCEYCESLTKIKWDGGTLPNCEHCGAPLSVQVKDEGAAGSGSDVTSRNETSSLSDNKGGIIGFIIAFLFVFFACGSLLDDDDEYADSSYDNGTYVESAQTSLPSSYYAAPIGRECYLDGEDYHDETTGCWFYFNEEVDPPVWQYWFEGISDNYGDYGWMEYDDAEAQWYIQDKKGKWIVLPAEYSTSNLWHFDDANKWEG
ncbi:MAG: hypothetical protein K6G16_10980 [Lachnospiraceae bacterium]|nr:hypothetical protein [Lachnospiraceae bacterium]